METNDKKVTEPIETTEMFEIADNKEEMISDTKAQAGHDLNKLWNRIGGMTLTEGVKSVWRYIKNLKIEQITIGIGMCIGLVLVGFIIYGGIPLFDFVWAAASNCFDMMAGERFAYSYSLLDRDLFYSVPFCLLVAVMVGIFSERHEPLCTMLYFLALLFILEVWDYWHIEYTANGILGGLCFVIMFIIVPVLYMVRFHASSRRCRPRGSQGKRDNTESI